MQQNKTTLERAFDLASSGALRSVADIRARLKAEGYDTRQIEGRTLVRQLSAIIRDKTPEAGPVGVPEDNR